MEVHCYESVDELDYSNHGCIGINRHAVLVMNYKNVYPLLCISRISEKYQEINEKALPQLRKCRIKYLTAVLVKPLVREKNTVQ